jgi:hypothetical protein
MYVFLTTNNLSGEESREIKKKKIKVTKLDGMGLVMCWKVTNMLLRLADTLSNESRERTTTFIP